MALGDYTPTAWVNDTTPAISATNLGHIETKIEEIDAASVATSGTIIWSTSNDGNGGQPPAPKPSFSPSSTDIGTVVLYDYTIGQTITAPAGGVWVVEILTYDGYTQTTFYKGADAVGGSIIGNATGNIRVRFYRKA